jgi:hypothetical protein
MLANDVVQFAEMERMEMKVYRARERERIQMEQGLISWPSSTNGLQHNLLLSKPRQFSDATRYPISLRR